MIIQLLNSNEYNSYYESYIEKTTDKDIIVGLKQNLGTIVKFYKEIPEVKHNYAYAEGKWTIKDILLHLIDTERVFTYRALRIARQDITPLAGFEQDGYVFAAKANKRTFTSLLEEYESVRLATVSLFDSFSVEDLLRVGEASGFSVSVRALGYMITGHENHHTKIIKERYL